VSFCTLMYGTCLVVDRQGTSRGSILQVWYKKCIMTPDSVALTTFHHHDVLDVVE
jgi:hypothetical protein